MYRRRSRSPRSSRRAPVRNHHYHNLLDVATGVWWMLETIAYNAVTPERFGNFTYNAGIVANNFVCQECKEHFNQFIEENPIENFMLKPSGEFDTLGAFRWMWMAHNNANRITGKPELPFEQALEFQQKQANGETCSSCTVSSSSGSKIREREMERRGRERRREETFRVRFSDIA